MTPLDLLAWVGAGAAAVIMIAIAVLVVFSVIREVRKMRRGPSANHPANRPTTVNVYDGPRPVPPPDAA